MHLCICTNQFIIAKLGDAGGAEIPASGEHPAGGATGAGGTGAAGHSSQCRPLRTDTRTVAVHPLPLRRHWQPAGHHARAAETVHGASPRVT